ncbi:MAG: hypothetical protein IKO10_16475 [Lachnospiraceae bacterium]|nr:hypothetical protein [Lachnospiraceae bacterium]
MKKKVLALSAVLIPLTLAGCGRMNYEKLTKDMQNETVYTSSSSALVHADVSLDFINLSETAQSDMDNAKELFGMDLSEGVDGSLEILMTNSMVSDDYMTYYNNFGTNKFTSSIPEVEAVIKDYLGAETSSSEIYADRKSGEVAASVDGGEWTSLGKESGVDTTLLTTNDILPILNTINQITEEENVKVSDTNIGYDITYKLNIDSSHLEMVPEEIRQMLSFKDFAFDQILNLVKKLDQPTEDGSVQYQFPATVTISFLKQEKEYKIQAVVFEGKLNITTTKTFEELGLDELVTKGLLPEGYRFDVDGKLDLEINYQNTFGYLPTKVME